MHDLKHFELKDVIEASMRVRRMGAKADSMESAAEEVVDFLYDQFVGCTTKQRCNTLVRLFTTQDYQALPPTLQEEAQRRMAESEQGGEGPIGLMRCLVLLASRGDEPGWNGRSGSTRHQVIPLQTAQMVEETPMVARLVLQMGLEIEDVVRRPEEMVFDLEQRSFDVFHVEEARGSDFVPSQTHFVERYGVRSVLGMGGLLPSRELFVVLMFSKVTITRETAALFRTLALNVKLMLLPFSGTRVFACQ